MKKYCYNFLKAKTKGPKGLSNKKKAKTCVKSMYSRRIWVPNFLSAGGRRVGRGPLLLSLCHAYLLSKESERARYGLNGRAERSYTNTKPYIVCTTADSSLVSFLLLVQDREESANIVSLTVANRFEERGEGAKPNHKSRPQSHWPQNRL